MTRHGPTPERPARAAHRLLAALVGLLLALTGIVVGAVPAAAQNRVGASTTAAANTVGPPTDITAGQRLGKTAPQPQMVVATGVAAETVPGFVVKPNGETVVIPEGAMGPLPVESGTGFQYVGGRGGHGLPNVATDVRIMDPVTTGKYPKPNGYVTYMKGSTKQAVNPVTGDVGIPNSDPMRHWEFGQ